MNHLQIDIPTVALILGMTHLMQVIVFIYQYRVNKAYRGVGWWLLWSAAEVIGFSVMLFRGIPGFFAPVVILQNIMLVWGTFCLYAGVQRFLGQRINLTVMIPILLIFLLGLIYFTIVHDLIQIRSVFLNGALSVIPAFAAISLLRSKLPSIRISARFNAMVFLLHSGIFAYRTLMILAGVPVGGLFEQSLFNLLAFFDALIVSLFWTFGFILMMNQRLTSDLAEARDQLQKIFNTSPDAALLTRMTDGMVMDVNDGYSTITGYSRIEMLGKSTLEIQLWKNPVDRDRVVDELTRNGTIENYEAPFILKDGREITGLMSARIIDIQGIPHIISITRDITHRKQIEDEIEEKNRILEEMNQEKDKFFSVLAHDLRNPFNSFLGFTHLLVEEADTLSRNDVHEIAISMRKTATNMYRLLDNLLEWAQVQLGRTRVTPELIVIKNIINKIDDLADDFARSKKLTLRYDVPATLEIITDAHMFETITRNLVFNALKFTEPGGEVTVIIRNRPDGRTELAVKDTGIGIPSGMVDRLFVLDKETSRKGTAGEPSTGLGLIICREFVEKLKGEIRVESQEGKGTLFTVIL